MNSTLALASLSMLAFAGNSLLCRLVLGGQQLDATSFTGIRLLSGALTLYLLFRIRNQHSGEKIGKRNLAGSFALFGYAAAFSFAYTQLDTGLGALVLFGVVQIGLITLSLINGEKASSRFFLGLALAMGGLIYLLLPQENTAKEVSVTGFSLMTIAGLSWAAYTWIGRGSKDAFADTTFNFLGSLPWVGLLCLYWLIESPNLSLEGALWACAAGIVTSGMGYALWYAVLPRLDGFSSASMQLTVPIIAAAMGWLFLDEAITTTLILSSVAVLGGVGLVIWDRQHSN